MARSAAFRRLSPPKNLTTELVEVLAKEIISGKLAPGARLLTEQEMMATFGVSRTVVREAVSALRSEGLVQTRQGVGAFVAPDVAQRPFRIDPKDTKSVAEVLSLMELRMGVEIEAAGLAARRRTDKHLARIEAELATIDAAIERGEAAVEADFELHRAIAAATGNGHFASFLGYLGHYIIPRQSVRIGKIGGDEQVSYLRKVQREHRAICSAIAKSDEAGARDAMRAHLANSIARYQSLM
jgi:DNA-binding FadR family transcriptional regulator